MRIVAAIRGTSSSGNDSTKPSSTITKPPANKLQKHNNKSPTTPNRDTPPRMIPNTIRTVPSYEAPSDISSYSPSIATKTSHSDFSSSVNSTTSDISMASRQNSSSSTNSPRPSRDTSSPTVRLKHHPSDATAVGHPKLSAATDSEPTIRLNGNSLSTSMSSNFGTGSPSRSVRSDDFGRSGISVDSSSNTNVEGSPQWDSSIGKAGLGKTGRVINKLVSDNDALKRDLKIERLRAEEAKQAAKLTEDKMDRMASDYESRLLEANVNKTLLARKERQVETLQAAVDTERQRTEAALERERSWREEMERLRGTTAEQVEKANTEAALMEGRYNVISGQWGRQADDVKRLRSDMGALVKERARDDERIATLRDLCDQQDANIRALTADKERIARLFEAYKREQDESLRDIKELAAKRQAEQEQLAKETTEALHKLKWALNVKENVKTAQ